jgi:16S rRNA (guanine527-N7)-methyltransferase
MEEEAIRVRQVCLRNGLPISDLQLDQLKAFVAGLREWNRVVNVISRKDEQNIWFNHILHCLTPLFLVDIPKGINVLDLGSGGGLPGIPLAIVRPDLFMTLLDSIAKKTKVMDDIRIRLGLSTVRVRTGRAEEVGKEPQEQRAYDLVVARAVASLSDLIRWSSPFLGKEGLRARPRGEGTPIELLALKGGDLATEEREARIKTGASMIRALPIVFDGSLELGLVEKKIVIVRR